VANKADQIKKGKQQMNQSEAILLTIAKCSHEAERAFRWTFGDLSMDIWDKAEQQAIADAVRNVAAYISNPESGPELRHNIWLAEKQAEGWTYGTEIDSKAKKHPYIKPFHHLPDEKQAIDNIVHAVIRSLT